MSFFLIFIINDVGIGVNYVFRKEGVIATGNPKAELLRLSGRKGGQGESLGCRIALTAQGVRISKVFWPAKRKSGGIMAHQNIRAMMPPDAGRTKTFISL